jgi:magnesium-dependent phosphatase 1
MVHYDVGLQAPTKGISSCLVAGENMPSAVLFDLDMTCWPFTLAIESHGPPYTSMSNEVGVIDHDSKKLRLFKDLPGILLSLHKAQIPIVLCSRSSVPVWCQEVIANCPIDPKNQPNLMFADVIHSASVIRPGLKKVKHLKEIRAALDVPFHQLLFFDDDERNCADGRRLGVRCVKVDRTGVTPDKFVEGLRLFSSPEPEFEEIQDQEEVKEVVPALPTISDRMKILCAPRGKDVTDSAVNLTGSGARRGDSLRSVMGRLTAAR